MNLETLRFPSLPTFPISVIHSSPIDWSLHVRNAGPTCQASLSPSLLANRQSLSHINFTSQLWIALLVFSLWDLRTNPDIHCLDLPLQAEYTSRRVRAHRVREGGIDPEAGNLDARAWPILTLLILSLADRLKHPPHYCLQLHKTTHYQNKPCNTCDRSHSP